MVQCQDVRVVAEFDPNAVFIVDGSCVADSTVTPEDPYEYTVQIQNNNDVEATAGAQLFVDGVRVAWASGIPIAPNTQTQFNHGASYSTIKNAVGVGTFSTEVLLVNVEQAGTAAATGFASAPIEGDTRQYKAQNHALSGESEASESGYALNSDARRIAIE